MIYKALDIAKYVVDYSFDRKKTVSNLRLQKILYFIQAEFLVSKNIPCFFEDIYAWSLGPVVPEVYREYKIFGSASIPSKGTKDVYYEIMQSDKDLINEMVDQCNEYSTSMLVQFTHEHDPWIRAFKSPVSQKISLDAIKAYFSEA